MVINNYHLPQLLWICTSLKVTVLAVIKQLSLASAVVDLTSLKVTVLVVTNNLSLASAVVDVNKSQDKSQR